MGLFFHRMIAMDGVRKKKMKKKKVRRRTILKSNPNPEITDDVITMEIDSNPEIPDDVITMEIMTKFPTQSLVRFRCVSKLWSSVTHRPDFIESFSTQPRVLLYLRAQNHGKSALLSSPHPCRGAWNSLYGGDVLITGLGMTGHVPVANVVHSFICLGSMRRRVRICNPLTRQIITLPKFKSGLRFKDSDVFTLFGYDPVGDQYKVLTIVAIMDREQRLITSQHNVFVVGASSRSWRSIQCASSHYPATKSGIYIDGVLYYGAWNNNYMSGCVVVSFDVSSEEFNLVELPFVATNIWRNNCANIINYGVKVAVVLHHHLRTYGIITLWVLEDALKREWSHKSFYMPVFQLNLVYNIEFYVSNGFHAGELILVPQVIPNPFYILYFDTLKNIVRKVEIEGLPNIEFWTGRRVYAGLWEYVESFKFMKT